MKQTGERETFVVRILNTQNATWQGTVTWTDGKRMESFQKRSGTDQADRQYLTGAGCPDTEEPPERGEA